MMIADSGKPLEGERCTKHRPFLFDVFSATSEWRRGTEAFIPLWWCAFNRLHESLFDSEIPSFVETITWTFLVSQPFFTLEFSVYFANNIMCIDSNCILPVYCSKLTVYSCNLQVT